VPRAADASDAINASTQSAATTHAAIP
jgi:hypothetical protein